MNEQLKVLTRQGRNSDTWDVRYVYGEVLRGTRVRTTTAGAELPSGGTPFAVPGGTVRKGEAVQWKGTNFRVVGVSPIPPFATRDRLETDQMQGTIKEA